MVKVHLICEENIAMQKIDGFKTSFVMTNEHIEKLDKIARKHKTTRSEALRMMLDLGIDVYSDLETIGVPQLAQKVKEMKKWIREKKQPALI